MFDPVIQLDPFALQVRPRLCPHCGKAKGGRLWVDSQGDRRRVWCDECDWSQWYTPSGPMKPDTYDEAKHKPADARKWNRHGMPSVPAKPKEPAMPKSGPRALKTCPQCNQQVKRFRRDTGKCDACSSGDDRKAAAFEQAAERKPKAHSVTIVDARPKNAANTDGSLADPIEQLKSLVGQLKDERQKLAFRVRQINEALGKLGELAGAA